MNPRRLSSRLEGRRDVLVRLVIAVSKYTVLADLQDNNRYQVSLLSDNVSEAGN